MLSPLLSRPRTNIPQYGPRARLVRGSVLKKLRFVKIKLYPNSRLVLNRVYIGFLQEM